MADQKSLQHFQTRRQFFGQSATGIGTAALASLFNPRLFAAGPQDLQSGGLPSIPHFTPTAKRVIFLHQSGAPAQMELFDYKPKLVEMAGTELPASVRLGADVADSPLLQRVGITDGCELVESGHFELVEGLEHDRECIGFYPCSD